MQTIKIQTSQNIELSYALAGVGDRMIAYLIDNAIYFAYYLLLFLLHQATKAIFNNNYISFLAILPILLYSLFCEIFMNGQTIGKKAKNIKVISLNGAQASFGQYLIRWIFSLLDITFSLGVIAVVMVSLTEKNQRLGDLIAGTTVVRTDSRRNINETIFEETIQAYQPQYPQVTLLHENDISLIKEVLNRHYKMHNPALLKKTADKIKSVLALQSDHEAGDFLKTVIKDYNYLTAQSV
jgi:uncharacterized RDD family membrane protein YckC